MDFYKVTLKTKEEMIIYEDSNTKNKRDEYFQQLCEYKLMIRKLTRTCICKSIDNFFMIKILAMKSWLKK